MTLLSKPYKMTFRLVGFYLSQLSMNPIKTKSISSSIVNGLGNYMSQRMAGGRFINFNSVLAFVLFGLLFDGAINHYFYETIGNFLSENSNSASLQLFLIERLVFMPVHTFFTLYILSKLEGKNHEHSFDNASAKFPLIVETNLKFLSLLQYINIFFLPPMLRPLMSNLIGFFWVMYLSQKRKEK